MSSGTFEFGAVFYWENFGFSDGGKSNKLFVVLGAKNGKDAIVLITTSQNHWPKNEGCHAKDGYYFFRAGGQAGFIKDTWVDLTRAWELSSAEMLAASFKDDLRVKWNLPKSVAATIRNCAKRSRDITRNQIALME